MDKVKKALFVCLHRKDRSPSQRFRFEQYLDFLNHNGWKCEMSFLLNADDDKNFYKPGNILKKGLIVLKSTARRISESLLKKNKYDIVFIQRECFMLGTSFFEKQFSKSKAKVIFDFDDSIWIPNVSEANKKLAFLKNPNKTAEIIAVSDLIFAGNNFLANYAKQFNNNVTIIPTTIDTKEYQRRKVEKTKPGVCIGWSGSVTTIQHFEFALDALKIIQEKYGDKVYFKVIGDANYKNDELGITGIGWNKTTELDDLSEIEIGLMPLPDDKWASGKCGLKGLQYMALEISTIMSPVGVNSDIIQDGKNGFLASTTEEWVEKLSILIDDAPLRNSIGKAGRATVVNDYSVEATKDKYLHHFNALTN